MPALPGIEQLVVVAALLEHRLQLHFVATVLAAVLAVLGLAVLRFHARHDRRQFGALRGVVGRRRGHALSATGRWCGAMPATHRLAVELLRLLDRLAERGQEALVGAGAQQLRVDRDVGGLRPAGGVQFEGDVREFLVEPGDELVAGFGRCRAQGRDRAQRDGDGRGEARTQANGSGGTRGGASSRTWRSPEVEWARTQSRPTFVSTR